MAADRHNRGAFLKCSPALALLAALGAALIAGPGMPGVERVEGAFPGANGKIAFFSDRDGDYEVYLMNPDGSGQTRLTNQPGSDWQPAWSPNGTKISFVSERDGNHEIYVMNADGSGQTRLTNSPAYDLSPSWSPDGQKMAFSSTRDHYYSEIYVMNADGTNVTRLTFNTAADGTPRWSPDGTKIGFTSDRDGNSEIYVMNTDGSDQQNLTNHPHTDGAFSWSPNGTKIAFTTTRASSSPGGGVDNYEIFVMDADGSNPVNLTNTTQQHPLHGYEFSPAWSPDGSKIAFHAVGVNDAPDPAFVRPIFSMNADGSGVTRLTDGVATDEYADWQPLVAPEPTLTPTPQPTPTPTRAPAVGGISIDPDVGDTSPEAADSGAPGAGLPARVAIAIAAGVVAVGGVAWYVRRRAT